MKALALETKVIKFKKYYIISNLKNIIFFRYVSII